MSLLVVGSVAFDSVSTPCGSVEKALGGSAIYFSVAASFFTRVNLVGVVGDDFPRRHVDFLREKGINVKGLERQSGKTFFWKGRYGEDMNTASTLATRLNVFEKFCPVLPDEYRDSEYVFLANIDPVLQMKVLEQVRKPSLVAADTMNLWIKIRRPALKRVIKKIDILVINDGEAKQLAGESNLVKAAKKILKLGVKTLIVKRGEYGSMMFSGSSVFFAPAYPLENVVDTTGAGDTFAGGMMGFLAKTGDASRANICRAVLAGAVMSSFDVEDFSIDGMRMLRMCEIKERLRKMKGLVDYA